ncbi:Osmotin thaumatin-like protein [Lactarius deliciosus]|nr:Osmotin thaumatin-like protein [Lactarius deliciosus]
MRIPLLTSASSLFTAAMGRTFTVYNACPFTIWPALFTDLNVGSATPNQATGWTAPAFTAVSFSVPDNWKAGRIWLLGRRNCDFSTNPGPNSCLDGGCSPATVAEFTLSTDPNSFLISVFAVSLVDGYNLPMRINNNKGCGIPLCGVDLGPNCQPRTTQRTIRLDRFPVGCKSACVAGLAPDPNNSPNCCTGSHNTAATCPPSGNQIAQIYVYAYDESSGDALFSCPSSNRADYTITFCP